jgi:hypothetical protein
MPGSPLPEGDPGFSGEPPGPIRFLSVSEKTIRATLGELSFAELEEFCQDLQRRLVLEGPDASPRTITRKRIAQWKRRRATHRS